MIIDFHNHYYPPGFVDAVQRGESNFTVTFDDVGNPVLHSPGDYNVLVPGHRLLDARIEALEEAGVDMQVLTLTAPGTTLESPARAVELAAIVNDGLTAAVESHPHRFSALAHLPMTDPAGAVRELDRAMVQLGLPGAMVYGNIGGVPLADDRFEPVWERANESAAVIYIHPTYPLGVEAMKDFMLMPLVGFMMDTTLAAAHLVFAGVPERYPRIRWVLCHTGGTIPFLAERLDRGYEAFRRCRDHITKPPSEYLKRFWYDTVNFDPKCLKLALDFAGPEQIVAGSDYPHMIGSLERMEEVIEAQELEAAGHAAVTGGNARGLLGLG
ncbi:MAG TPA: amidohydrolase family protein [Longimicrobiaceae bacterium]|nr:amidohydrolase family protein [Longimicrobiaceae bacterium]